ncbi:MAG TPA: hypothetical protein VGK16_05265 [Candidatus Limnocylindrales bacterium]|jgi:hypothetical protein
MIRAPRRLRGLRRRHVVALLLAVVVLLGAAVVATDAFGSREKLRGLARRVELLVDPPPDRAIAAAVLVTPEPGDDGDPLDAPTPEPTASPSLAPGATPPPPPTATPAPQRVKVDVNLLQKPDRWFITEIDKEWCAVAGSQMVMAIHGKADLSESFQRKLESRIGEWESRRDSLNGGWGPSAMVKALETYGVPGYEVRAYETRASALKDAAKAISRFHAPVILLAWRGAHTWVMTGYRADADPLVFRNARINGAYILDPWYPRVSSIWGPSDRPGAYQDAAEMRRNYLPWRRPEGRYPDRDGLFIAVVPTQPLNR